MIVRAVSDSDSDSENAGVGDSADSPRRSVFDPPPLASAASTSAGSARRVWLATCVALVLLVLVDLAALTGQWSALLPVVDAFALLPMLLSTLWSTNDAGSSLLLPPTATIVNQLVGLALVGAWIYTRETRMATSSASSLSLLANAKCRYGLATLIALGSLGHVVSCLYVLFALVESNGDRTKFWLGRRRSATQSKTAPYARV